MGRLTHLLDTDISVFIARNRLPSIRNHFYQFTSDQLGMSVISYGELLSGVEKSADAERAMQQLELLLSGTTILPLTEEVASVYAVQDHRLRSKGEPIGANDLWIAAHALTLDCTLVTNNEREFRRISDLRIENWTR